MSSHLILLRTICRKGRFQIPHMTGGKNLRLRDETCGRQSQTQSQAVWPSWFQKRCTGENTEVCDFSSRLASEQRTRETTNLGQGGDSDRSAHGYYGWEKVTQSPWASDMPCVIIILLSAKLLYHSAAISLFLASISRPLYKYFLCYQLRH